MAPRHYIGAVVDIDTSRAFSRHLLRRSLPSDFLIATVVVVSVMSTLLLASVVFLLSWIWRKVVASRINSRASEKSQTQGAAPGCTQSDWARKNSNVLWSSYIEEDDLQAQFAVSPKSRAFSIGSVSMVEHGRYPLDRRRSDASPLTQHKITENDLSKTNSIAPDLRIRAPFEHQQTPKKNIARARAMSSPSRHRDSNSFEEAAKRKQSLPGPARIAEDFKEVYT